MPRYLYGTQVLTLSEVVDELNVVQNNVKQNYAASNLIHAKWVWKDLLWTTEWSVAQVALDIVDGKIQLPNDVIRIVNISAVDKCGKIQPLGHNPNINTLDIRCSTNKCGCGCGGKDTYCAQVDNMQVKEETITINGTDYTKTTYIRVDNQGNLYEVANIPAWNTATDEVVFTEERSLLCNLELTTDGCIKETEANRCALAQYCGCYIPGGIPEYNWWGYGSCYWDTCGDWRERKECKRAVPVVHNDFGYYNWDARAKDVVHIKDTKAVQVIVGYQTSGESDNTEMLVPEYALDAMLAGIYYRQRQYSPVVSWGEKQQSMYAYRAAKTRLFEFKNPLRADVFVKLQDIIPRWGA